MCQKKKIPPFLLAVRPPPVTPYDFPMPFPARKSPSATLRCSTSARNTGKPVVDVRSWAWAMLGKTSLHTNIYHILLMTLCCRSMNLDSSISILRYHIIICCESAEKHVAAYVWTFDYLNPWSTKPRFQIHSTHPNQSSASCLPL